MQRVEVAGGSPTVIWDGVRGRGGTWNAAGDILFNAVNDGPLLRVHAEGGKAEPLTRVDQGENSHRWPVFLSDGRRFLYFARAASGGSGRIWAASLDDPSQRVEIARTNASAVVTQAGGSQYILWTREEAVMAQKFDPKSLRLEGEAVAIGEGVARSVFAGSYLSQVSASRDGVIVWNSRAMLKWDLAWIGRDGVREGTTGPADTYVGLRLSPDGKRVVLDRGGTSFTMEFARGIPSRVTPGGSENPLWSHDGQRIVYRKGGPPNLMTIRADGGGSEETVLASNDSKVPLDCSPDGKWLLYYQLSNDLSVQTRSSLWVLPFHGGQPQPYLQTPHRYGVAAFSPDGKWIAYASDESGLDEIYVHSFPAGGPKWRVSGTGGNFPRWRRDGQELFYLGAQGKLMALEVRKTGQSLEFGRPMPLLPLQTTAHSAAVGPFTYPYDVAPDGKRFLVLSPVGEVTPPSLAVAIGWERQFAKR